MRYGPWSFWSAERRGIYTKHVTVRIPKEIMEWPGYREDIYAKVAELEELISSIITGQTERWR